jgi:multisubunit Na+/H+ antiporter MnhG subunit|tara:strand:+ start:104 stop:238 length:135 start_codon:yes stop_codon:yes gene_type:complete
MNKKTVGITIVIFGLIIFFSNEKNAWIVSAIFLGVGSGIFFWKD